jgi:hypothetical protein
MHSLFLWDNKKLLGLSAKNKTKKINDALKQFRKDKPVNYMKRLGLIALVSLVPSLALYYVVGFSLAIAWLSVSAVAFELTITKREAPVLCKYIS